MDTLFHFLHGINATTAFHWLHQHATIDNYLHLVGTLRSIEWIRQKFTTRPVATPSK